MKTINADLVILTLVALSLAMLITSYAQLPSRFETRENLVRILTPAAPSLNSIAKNN